MRERHTLNFHKICRVFSDSVLVLLLQRSLLCYPSVNAVVNFHYNLSYNPSTIFVVYPRLQADQGLFERNMFRDSIKEYLF
jgi:hypothetical protein